MASPGSTCARTAPIILTLGLDTDTQLAVGHVPLVGTLEAGLAKVKADWQDGLSAGIAGGAHPSGYAQAAKRTFGPILSLLLSARGMPTTGVPPGQSRGRPRRAGAYSPRIGRRFGTWGSASARPCGDPCRTRVRQGRRRTAGAAPWRASVHGWSGGCHRSWSTPMRQRICRLRCDR
jgi:hypothetical protein